jgi:hypothetical protein
MRVIAYGWATFYFSGFLHHPGLYFHFHSYLNSNPIHINFKIDSIEMRIAQSGIIQPEQEKNTSGLGNGVCCLFVFRLLGVGLQYLLVVEGKVAALNSPGGDHVRGIDLVPTRVKVADSQDRHQDHY